MPNLRRGRILSFVAGPSFAYPGKVYPAMVLEAYMPTSGSFAVFTEVGVQYAPTLNVTQQPEQGGVFWPDQSAESDVNFVGALVSELATINLPITPAEIDKALAADLKEFDALGKLPAPTDSSSGSVGSIDTTAPPASISEPNTGSSPSIPTGPGPASSMLIVDEPEPVVATAQPIIPPASEQLADTQTIASPDHQEQEQPK